MMLPTPSPRSVASDLLVKINPRISTGTLSSRRVNISRSSMDKETSSTTSTSTPLVPFLIWLLLRVSVLVELLVLVLLYLGQVGLARRVGLLLSGARRVVHL